MSIKTIIENAVRSLIETDIPNQANFRHKVYHLSSDESLESESTPGYYVSSQFENERVHDLGSVTLPTNDLQAAQEIMKQRVGDFHTQVSADHNLNERPEFVDMNQDTFHNEEPFAIHHHADKDAHSHAYLHFLERENNE